MSQEQNDPLLHAAYEQGMKEGQAEGREKALNDLATRALADAAKALAETEQIREDLAPIAKLRSDVETLERQMGIRIDGLHQTLTRLVGAALAILAVLIFALWIASGGIDISALFG